MNEKPDSLCTELVSMVAEGFPDDPDRRLVAQVKMLANCIIQLNDDETVARLARRVIFWTAAAYSPADCDAWGGRAMLHGFATEDAYRLCRYLSWEIRPRLRIVATAD